MRDRINDMVHRQESFRPFAPACATEEAHRWFEVPPGAEFPTMTSSVKVRTEVRDRLPAVTNVNGFAQLQTVSEKDNPDFHALLVAVGETTGRQMLLNTSFSVDGQPIVNTPEDAIEAFLVTGIDQLFLENFQISRAKS
jgi:carbamoyltransferase